MFLLAESPSPLDSQAQGQLLVHISHLAATIAAPVSKATWVWWTTHIAARDSFHILTGMTDKYNFGWFWMSFWFAFHGIEIDHTSWESPVQISFVGICGNCELAVQASFLKSSVARARPPLIDSCRGQPRAASHLKETSAAIFTCWIFSASPTGYIRLLQDVHKILQVTCFA